METNPDLNTIPGDPAALRQGTGSTNSKPAGQLPSAPAVSADERAEAMDPECVSFLNLARKPAVVYDVEAGWLSGL
jgi:hypothetical protein